MLVVLACILVLLWAGGMWVVPVGDAIYLLLVLALLVFLLNYLPPWRGRP